MTLAERAEMNPAALVPQLANPSVKKREKKIMEKDRRNEKVAEE